MVKITAEKIDGCKSIDVTFDPKNIGGKLGEIWYLDEKDNKQFILQSQSDISIYNENNESMKWFYDIMKKDHGIWMDLYISKGTHISTVTYSYPLKINCKAFGAVSVDINFESFKNMINNIKVIAIIMLVCVIGIIFIAYKLGLGISKPIELVTSNLNRFSNFDLSYSDESNEIKKLLLRKDEMGRASIKLKQELKGIVEVISETSENIYCNMNNLALATNEASHSINNVAKTIEGLARGAKETERGSDNLELLPKDIKSTVLNGEVVEKNSHNVGKATKKGLKSIENLVDKFKINVETIKIIEKILMH